MTKKDIVKHETPDEPYIALDFVDKHRWRAEVRIPGAHFVWSDGEGFSIDTGEVKSTFYARTAQRAYRKGRKELFDYVWRQQQKAKHHRIITYTEMNDPWKDVEL